MARLPSRLTDTLPELPKWVERADPSVTVERKRQLQIYLDSEMFAKRFGDNLEETKIKALQNRLNIGNFRSAEDHLAVFQVLLELKLNGKKEA